MNIVFPLDKKDITFSFTNKEVLEDYSMTTQVPLYPHPGAFGVVRKNHIHEGIDLYAREGDNIYAMMDGTVIAILPFTGEIAGSPWWNDTYCVLIRHSDLSLNYGEITPLDTLKVGNTVRAGDEIGTIKTVLIKDKGLPMAMLHLEAYSLETSEPIKEWSLNSEKPSNLLNPTPLIIRCLNENRFFKTLKEIEQ